MNTPRVPLVRQNIQDLGLRPGVLRRFFREREKILPFRGEKKRAI